MTTTLSPNHWLAPGKRVETTYDFRKGTVQARYAHNGTVLVKWDDGLATVIAEFDLDIASE